MKKKYLHFLPFSKSHYPTLLVEWFEKVSPDSHIFIEFSDKQQTKTQKKANWWVINPEDFAPFVATYEFQKIFIHSHSPTVAAAILQYFSTPKKPTIVWLVWGGDFYYLPRVINHIFEPFAYRFFQRDWWWQARTRAGAWGISLGKPTAHTMMRSLKLIDVVGTIPTEFNLVKKYLPELKTAAFAPYWSLLSLMQYAKIPTKEVQNGQDILLGSSAGIGNNHFEALEWLAQQKSRPTGNIFCPLSSGREKYIQKIIEKGKILFGEKFVPILEFMPLADFEKLISNVNLVLYRHGRQEGFGALLPFLASGARIFLAEKNALFHDFKYEMKLHGIYSFSQSLAETPILTEQQIKENQEQLQLYFSDEAIFKQYQKLLEM